jgi:hypothetical protein
MSMLTAMQSPGQQAQGLPGGAASIGAKSGAFKAGLVCLSGLLLLAQAATLQAANFTRFGSEYEVIGAKAGSQDASAVALGASKGAVVWQDNQVDSDGLGIGMQWLNEAFSPSFSSFRVNVTEAGNQEHPRVAMLQGDGAVVVWQGGSEVDTDIYARFLSPDGTFMTGEIKVNTYTELLQINPDVAVLADGSVVVVWASFNQDGSYQGVYGQRFTSNGVKVGNEFQINQYTLSNQRNPSVTGLVGGGFVVAWVSEKPSTTQINNQLTPVDGGTWVQQIINNIEINARRYDVNGLAVGNEFRVDNGGQVCSSPNLCSREDGGFSIVWNQNVKGEDWDIYARSFDASGTGLGSAFLVNIDTDGKQFHPMAVASGNQLFVVWTSIKNDSYWDDIKGRFIGLAAAGSEQEAMINTQYLSIQNQPSLAMNRSGQALVVWTTFVGGVNSGDLKGQRYNSNQPLPAGPTPVVAGRDSNSITVSWADAVGLGVDAYFVTVNGVGGVIQVDGNTKQTIVTGLQPGTTYTCTVMYRLSDGRLSPQSATGSGRTYGVDTNGDGIPDEWQIANWGANASKWGTANEDSDGDGLTNYQEFLAGTDPRDANSNLKTQVQMVQGALYFKWNTVSGKVYQVQFSADFQNWTNVGTQRLATSGEDSVFIEQGSGVGFYRIVLVR